MGGCLSEPFSISRDFSLVSPSQAVSSRSKSHPLSTASSLPSSVSSYMSSGLRVSLPITGQGAILTRAHGEGGSQLVYTPAMATLHAHRGPTLWTQQMWGKACKLLPCPVYIHITWNISLFSYGSKWNEKSEILQSILFLLSLISLPTLPSSLPTTLHPFPLSLSLSVSLSLSHTHTHRRVGGDK